MIDLNSIKVLTAKEEETLQKKAEIEKNKEFDKNFYLLNAPKRYFNSRKEDLTPEEYKVLGSNDFIVLKGVIDTGKSYASAVLLNEHLKQTGKAGYFLRCYELRNMSIDDIKKLFKDISKKSIVVVDDIGMLIGNNFIIELMGSFLLKRIDDELKTIITTNENLAKSGSNPYIFDDRMASKLQEYFVTEICKKTGRRKKAKIIK
jgi:DNA replication protein DnaC